jgi:hypothetical protein
LIRRVKKNYFAALRFLQFRGFAHEIFWALIVFGSIASVTLITGVLKDEPNFFFPYIVCGCVSFVLVTLKAALYIQYLDMSDFKRKSPIIALQVLPVVLSLYFIICVLSYFVEVKKRQKEVQETVVSVVLPTTA